MKIALLGKGKTGSKVVELLTEMGIDFTIFDSTNTPTLEKLNGHEFAISFLPGHVFLEYVDILVEAKLNVVTGSTGSELPANLSKKLEDKNLSWIQGHNFSLGMNLVRQMMLVLDKANRLFDNYTAHIHEVHHTKKLDAPSGTALRWNNWLSDKATISSAREGDIVGDHLLTIKTSTEQINLQHIALDRKIFAQGAIWALNHIKNNKIEPGLHWFEDIALKELK